MINSDYCSSYSCKLHESKSIVVLLKNHETCGPNAVYFPRIKPVYVTGE